MTTLHQSAISHSGAPEGEDAMELSSEQDRRYTADEDIDIDLDLGVEHVDEGEIDYMIEDANSSADQYAYDGREPQAGHDDEMVDNVYTPLPAEDLVSNKDEDLSDADYIVQDSSMEMREIATATSSAQQEKENLEQELHTHADDEPYLVDRPSEPDLKQASHFDFEDDDDAHHQVITEKHEELAVDGLVEPAFTFQPATIGSEVNRDVDDNNYTQQGLGDKHPDQSQAVREELNEFADIPTKALAGELAMNAEFPGHSTSAQPTEEVHSTLVYETGVDDAKPDAPPSDAVLPQQTSVHPIIVVYQGDQMSLFPASEQGQEHSQTYFLHNLALMDESITILLESCRSVLGDSISDQDELEIKIVALDLSICESTTDASSTTLGHILDLYLQLQHRDGHQIPEPLHMTLSTKSKFSSRLRYLNHAVAEGKGLSRISSPSNRVNGSYLRTEALLTETYEDEGGRNKSPDEKYVQYKENSNTIEPTQQHVIPSEDNLPSPSSYDSQAEGTFFDVNLRADSKNYIEEGPESECEESSEQDVKAESTLVLDPNAEDVHEEAALEQHAEIENSQGKYAPTKPLQGDDLHANVLENGTLLVADLQSTDENPTISEFIQDEEVTHSSLEHESGTEDGDLIDYEEDDRGLQESSTATSTLQGDAPESALVKGGTNRTDEPGGKVIDKHFEGENEKQLWTDGNVFGIVADDTNEYGTYVATGNVGAVDGQDKRSKLHEQDGFSDHSHEPETSLPTSGELDLEEEPRKLKGISNEAKIHDQLAFPDFRTLNDETIEQRLTLDNDEITYEDEDTELQAQSDEQSFTPAPGRPPNDISLKRPRSDHDEGNMISDQTQDMKRLRSKEES